MTKTKSAKSMTSDTSGCDDSTPHETPTTDHEKDFTEDEEFQEAMDQIMDEGVPFNNGDGNNINDSFADNEINPPQDPPNNDVEPHCNLRQQLKDAGLLLSQTDINNESTMAVIDPTSPRKGFAVPSTAEEISEAKHRWKSDDAWQMKALKFINSDVVQRVLIALLVMDVLILFSELGEFEI